MLAIHANEETLCLQRLCSSVGFVKRVLMLDCDRQSAILLETNHAYHDNTKNIDVQYHFVRDMVEYKKVLLEKVEILKNVVESLTKSIST